MVHALLLDGSMRWSRRLVRLRQATMAYICLGYLEYKTGVTGKFPMIHNLMEEKSYMSMMVLEQIIGA